ncbi:MAG: NAD(P)/FAD-dependent oxidoreductase [Lachnospiraceae bacterium]|nr:NAD(P)/FAD-dependent oxidoreductase [Lachnospiraceae bacterium]
MSIRVGVVGGGAAGMMAAYAASKNGARVTIYEKNEKLGKKIYITGKGRCNFTNAAPLDEFYENIVSNKKFMYSSLNLFSNEDMRVFLEENGIRTKVERGNRVFPESDHASDVTLAFKSALQMNDVKINLKKEVKEVVFREFTDEGMPRAEKLKFTDGTEKAFDRIIICTGGLSYPATGSTGDGYSFAKQTGHKIKDIRPALVPLETKEEYVKKLQGLTLKNVTLTVKDGDKVLYSDFGELLFTHFGISGPLVLSASSYIGKRLRENPLQAEIDLKPALTEEQLHERLKREIEGNEKKTFYNVISSMLPKSMLTVLPELLSIKKDERANQVSNEKKQEFISLLKAMPFTITKTRGFREAIITQGGVDVKSVNPKTMESKIVKNLYFAGEVLDVDALTGGYNLQIAFSTGYAAGTYAAIGDKDK